MLLICRGCTCTIPLPFGWEVLAAASHIIYLGLFLDLVPGNPRPVIAHADPDAAILTWVPFVSRDIAFAQQTNDAVDWLRRRVSGNAVHEGGLDRVLVVWERGT